MWSVGLRFLRKLGSLFGKSYLVGLTLLIGLLESKTFLIRPFRCFLCREVEEDLDNLFWNCQHVHAMWNSFLQDFDFNFVGQRSARAMIEEFLHHPPFREKWCILWLVGVCAMIWDVWGERNDRVFSSRERRTIVRFVI